MQGHPKKGLGLFRHLTFRQETFRQTFHHGEFSPQEHFGMGIFWHHGRFDTGTLPHWDILEHGHFGTWKFQHRGRNVYFALHSSKMYICQNVPVLKYSCGEISQCRNIPVPKHPWCGNIPMPKYSHAKKSP